MIWIKSRLLQLVYFYIRTANYSLPKGQTIKNSSLLKDPDQRIKLNVKDHIEYKWITEDEIEKTFFDHNQEKKTAKRGFELLKSKTFDTS